jgi:BirA family biotin operon repressor/biotin-[acetyl-CoA-carboxylase] ligase
MLDQCDSTNEEAARMAEDGAPHGTVVIAETQRAGRGRFGRSWYSPRGGVWMSVIIKPRSVDSSTSSLPLIGAIAVAKTLALGWRVRAEVRWPNDVVVGGRKIAGMFVESKSKGNELTYAVLGIGLNANVDTSKAEQIRDSSTSLLMILGMPINREQLIADILFNVESLCEQLQTTGEAVALDALMELDWSRGREVKVRTVHGNLFGHFNGYETLGRTRIRTRNGLRLVESDSVLSVEYESDQVKGATG